MHILEIAKRWKYGLKKYQNFDTCRVPLASAGARETRGTRENRACPAWTRRARSDPTACRCRAAAGDPPRWATPTRTYTRGCTEDKRGSNGLSAGTVGPNGLQLPVISLPNEADHNLNSVTNVPSGCESEGKGRAPVFAHTLYTIIMCNSHMTQL